MRNYSGQRCRRTLAFALGYLGLVACSGSGVANRAAASTVVSRDDTTTLGTSSSPSPTGTVTWKIALTATVTSPSGQVPFALRSQPRTDIQSLVEPVTMVLVASAPVPTVVVGRAELFKAHLRGSGTLDVGGPSCGAHQAFCGVDPVVLPIGVAYNGIVAPTPTGPILNALNLPLRLELGGVRSGQYRMVEEVAWLLADDPSGTSYPATVSVVIDVSGPV